MPKYKKYNKLKKKNNDFEDEIKALLSKRIVRNDVFTNEKDDYELNVGLFNEN